MSKKFLGSFSLVVFLCLGFWACKKEISGSTDNGVQQNLLIQKKVAPTATASLFASGFNDPVHTGSIIAGNILICVNITLNIILYQ